MAKKNKPVVKSEPVNPKLTAPKVELKDPALVSSENSEGSIWALLTRGWIPYIIVVVLGLGLYANTFHHEYALDDDIIICKNEHVLKGVAGMGDIMTKDVFDSYYKSLNLTAQLAGGRYRPFSVATYAVEQEFIGTLPDGLKQDSWDVNKNKIKDASEDVNKDGLWTDRDFKIRGATMRHINNVLLYILSVCLIYFFLSKFFFKENKMLALFTSLLFLAHPLHSEVVANMKSRDEILSLMFIVLTLYFSFLYVETKQRNHAFLAAISYFIALLSKEYGATLLLIVPLSLWVYYKQLEFSKILPLLAGIGIAFLIYYMLRSRVVLDIGDSAVQDSELLNNPYLLATDSEASATKVFMNFRYFILLIFPYAMSCDYSYNVIPYKEYSDIGVILSILILIGSVAGLIYTIRKRSWLAFPIVFALAHLFLVNNLFFNIGATMGERLVYHTSLGTCILMVYGLYYLFTKVIKINGQLIAVILFPLLAAYSYKTIARNPAWKNDFSLTLTDVKTYPNSVMLNGNACNRLIEMSEWPKNSELKVKYLDSGLKYGLKAMQLHPKYVTNYLNLGLIKYKTNQVDSAAFFWSKVIELFPTHPNVPMIRQTLLGGYSDQARQFLAKGQTLDALNALLKAHKFNAQDPKLNFDIGNMYSVLQNPAKAREYYGMGLRYAPNDANLQNAMRAVGG